MTNYTELIENLQLTDQNFIWSDPPYEVKPPAERDVAGGFGFLISKIILKITIDLL